MRFIGDVHGYFDKYRKIAAAVPRSIQVGDMGVGFPGFDPAAVEIDADHRFIRGNHDDPDRCREVLGYIQDGMVDDRMMFVGGASSIDRHVRTEGVNWWADEELSIRALDEVVERAMLVEPEIMVTHECPESVARRMMPSMHPIPSRTRQAFDALLEGHRPALWIFGHWHVTKTMSVGGTMFICLGELDYVDLDMDEHVERARAMRKVKT
jgi:Icc-related predicted phosphoesterase